MATPSKRLHPAPVSGGASVAVGFPGYAGLEHPNLAGVFGNPGCIMTDEVGSYECSVTRKGQPIPPEHEIMSIDRQTRVISCAAGVTFDYLEQSSAYCLMVNETEKRNVAADLEASADVDVTKTKLTDGCCHDADVTVFSATRRPLQALDKDRLAEGEGALMVDNYEYSVIRNGKPFRCPSQITKAMETNVCCHDADVTAFSATRRPLLALDKDQLAEGKGALMENALYEKISPRKNISSLKLYSMMKVKYVDPFMLYMRQVVQMIGKVAKVKQPVASLEVSSDSGTSAYSVHGTKSRSSSLRVCQVWVFLLVIFLSPLQVSPLQDFSSAEAKRDSAEIGSCRFDLTSVAALSCVELDGSWRPPSMSCCNALLYAIDHLPASNESGACCLCRYMSRKYSYFALAISYVLCKGKDRSIITTWSSVPQNCYMVCRRRNASSLAVDTPAVVSVLDTRSKDFRIPWIAALVVAAFCAIMLATSCYHWWYKPIPTGVSQPRNLQRRGLPGKAREEQKPSRRHSSALRRLSSRDSLKG